MYRATAKLLKATLWLAIALSVPQALGKNPLLELATSTEVEPEIKTAAQEAIARLVSGKNNNINDIELKEYLSHLAKKLDPLGNYHIGILKDEQLNAFATIGGVIMINSGLWLSADSEAELAGVLAHEIAHLKLQHLQRGIDQNSKDALLSMASVAAGLLISNTQLQEALLFSGPALQASSQLAHSRQFEMEADSIGLDLLKQARFNPNGLFDFLAKIQQLELGGNIPEYLRTHPISTSRMGMLRNRIENAGTTFQSSNEFDFLLLRRKLASLSKTETKPIEAQIEELEKTSVIILSEEKVIGIYGLLLSAVQHDNWEAFRYAERLMQIWDIKHPSFLVALTDGMRKKNRKNEALSLIKDSVKSHPDNYMLAVTHSRLLGERPNPQSLEQVRRYTQAFENPFELLKLEANILDHLGRKIESHLQLANLYLTRGRIRAAQSQIQIAKKLEKQSATLEDRLLIMETEKTYDFFKKKLDTIFS